ncbi:thioredoxin family protein, partial [Candidatus Woesearchaeota archaeon]|nr:thioredoxin family protein [Candidatus Woesearchaeota archaeon]
AKEFSLQGADGKTHARKDFKKDILIVFFSCNHCPYVKAVEDRVIAFVKKYGKQVDVIAINSNDEVGYPQDSFTNMVARGKEKKFNFVYARDESQDVARAYGGLCTPHFFVFDKDRKLRYQGSFDDNWEHAAKAKEHYVENAVIALLAGKPIAKPTSAVRGCSIKWK